MQVVKVLKVCKILQLLSPLLTQEELKRVRSNLCPDLKRLPWVRLSSDEAPRSAGGRQRNAGNRKADRKADRYALVIAFRCDMMWVSPSLVRRQKQGLGFHSWKFVSVLKKSWQILIKHQSAFKWSSMMNFYWSSTELPRKDLRFWKLCALKLKLIVMF